MDATSGEASKDSMGGWIASSRPRLSAEVAAVNQHRSSKRS